jgi:hypothetical protein
MGLFGDRFCDQPGFACMVDILLKLARCGAQCGEVGMILRYDQKEGPSAMKISQTIGHTLRLLWNHRTAKRFVPPLSQGRGEWEASKLARRADKDPQ